MISYLKAANTGVKGVVKFEDGTIAKYVTIKIDNRQPFFKTNEDGEFYRILLPGTYNLTVAFNCLGVYSTKIVVTNTASTQVDIQLPSSFKSYYSTSTLNRYGVFCDSINQQGSSNLFPSSRGSSVTSNISYFLYLVLLMAFNML